MNNQRGIASIILVLIVIALIGGGILVQQYLDIIKFKLRPGIPMQETLPYIPKSCAENEDCGIDTCQQGREKCVEIKYICEKGKCVFPAKTVEFSSPPYECAENRCKKAVTESEKVKLTSEILKNTKFYCQWYNTTVQLKNGRYIKEYPDSASMLNIGIFDDKVALGDLNNDRKEDAAVILDSSGGGSGHFYELAVVVNQNGSPHHLTSKKLGDRIIINSITIQSGVITINMIVHGPNDGLCCPSLKKVVRYKLSDNQLIEVKEDETADWETFIDKEAGYSFKYPDYVTVLSTDLGRNQGLLSIIISEAMAAGLSEDAKDLVLFVVKEKISSDSNSRSPIGYGNSFAVRDSKKTIKIGDNDKTGNISMILKTFEVCSVQFARRLIFSHNGYNVQLDLESFSNKIITEMPEYFTINEKNCGKSKIWKAHSNFYNDLVVGKGQGDARLWYDTFDKILSTFRFLE